MNRRELIDLVLERTVSDEAYPFKPQNDGTQAAVIRHKKNKKTIAIVMEHEGQLLINLKLTPAHVAEAIQTHGVIPGFHMNKTHWVSVVVNDTDVKIGEMNAMIDESSKLTK